MAGPAVGQRPAEVAFVDVGLLPLDVDTVLEHRTVIVRGDRIVRVGPTSGIGPGKGALVIDGRGKYLMPGLVDMHVHLFNSRDLLLYIANGVTTIRNLGGYGAADSILEIRRQIAAGARLGPTIFTSGNWLDGDPPFRPINTVVRTPAEARAIVTQQKKAGYDFIKVYQTLAPEVYREIVRTARELKIPVTGHVPSAVGIEGVLESGQAGVDHVEQLAGGDPAVTARRVHESGVAVTTTLVMLDRVLSMRGRPEAVESLLALPEARYLSPATRQFWRRAPYFGMPKADPARSQYSGAEERVRALEAAGARVMAGTDAGIWGNEPGYSGVEEVIRLAAAGLTPYQALRAATVEPAEFLNRWVSGAGQPGAIREGSRADLLLLDANPLENPGALRRQAGVMARGRWLPRGKLDELLDELARAYEGGASSHRGLR